MTVDIKLFVERIIFYQYWVLEHDLEFSLLVWKQKAELQNNGELIYIKPEDEILHQVCLHQALLPQNFQLLHGKNIPGIEEGFIYCRSEASSSLEIQNI